MFQASATFQTGEYAGQVITGFRYSPMLGDVNLQQALANMEMYMHQEGFCDFGLVTAGSSFDPMGDNPKPIPAPNWDFPQYLRVPAGWRK